MRVIKGNIGAIETLKPRWRCSPQACPC